MLRLASGYRYGFNGKENDSEVKGEGNQQDYGFRIYDSRIGKFLSIDPLTQEYPWNTPYQFADNTPIQAIDLDGLEEWMVQQAFALKQKVQFKIENAAQVAAARVGAIKERKENWAERVRNFSAMISTLPGGGGAWTSLLINFVYGVANDAKITYTSAVYGPKHARGLDNLQVKDDKERVGAGLNTLVNAVLPLVGPVKLTNPQFKVDLMGGKVSRYDDFINFDKNAVMGIADDCKLFKTFWPRISFYNGS